MQFVFLFCCHIRASVLQPFFRHYSSAFDQVDWGQSPESLLNALQGIIDSLPSSDGRLIQRDMDRIEKMTGEYAQRLLIKSNKQTDDLVELLSSLERSCWAFTNTPDVFSEAESIGFKDRHHHVNQHWGHYLVPPNLPMLACDEALLQRFNEHVEKAIGLLNDKVVTYYAKREQINPLNLEQSEWHFIIYHSQLSDHCVSFDNDKTLHSGYTRFAARYEIIYTATTGVIEVFSEDESSQSTLAHLFSSLFLQQQTLVMRQFSLTPLLKQSPLLWDHNDGIQSVDITRIKVQDIEWNSHLQIDFPAEKNKQCDIHQHALNYLGVDNPLNSDLFVPIESTIVISFHDNSPLSHRKRLLISITLPNQCDLRRYTQAERALIDQYLTRWGIIEAAA